MLATNGYTGKLGYFRDGLFPLHSHLFATARLPDPLQQRLGWHGLAGFSDDLDRISYGTLTRNGHLIFGGGSNAAYSYFFNNGTALPSRSTTAQRAQGADGTDAQPLLPIRQ